MATRKTTITNRRGEPVASPAEVDDRDAQDMVDVFCTFITRGDLDTYITQIDDALTERANKHLAAAKSTPKKRTSTTVVPAETPAPVAKKQVAVPSKPVLTPVVGKVYVIRGKGVKEALLGKPVKFAKFHKDDETKAVVIITTDDVEGYPKDRRILVPVSTLHPSARRSK